MSRKYAILVDIYGNEVEVEVKSKNKQDYESNYDSESESEGEGINGPPRSSKCDDPNASPAIKSACNN